MNATRARRVRARRRSADSTSGSSSTTARRAPGGCVSGSRLMATRALTKAMPAATKNGTRGPASAASPPRAGPNTKPTPNAALSRPRRWARSSGGATSVTAPCATETLAPDAPSTMRPTNSIHTDVAPPVITLPTAVPNSDSRMTGRRPIRSDSRPNSGEKISWATENDETTKPSVVGLAPSRSP